MAEIDALGVAAALKVEDAAVGPAMLIIANQSALRVGREGGLTSARKSKEDSNIRSIILGHVCRAVHREHANLREVVVHCIEDRLLDLARVPSAHNQNQLALQALHDAQLVLHAVLCWVLKFKARGINDGPVILPGWQLIWLGVDEERLGEQTVPCFFSEDGNLQAVLGVRAGVSIEAEHILLGTHVLHDLCMDQVKVRRTHGLIDLAPRDVAVNLGGVFEVLVVRAASRARAGIAVQGAVGGKHSFAAGDRQFNKAGCSKVGMNGGGAEVMLLAGSGGRSDGHGGVLSKRGA